MKKLLILLTLFLFIAPTASAAIIQGNSSATVNVQTNVEGQGSVTTHIVTDVNGNTQTYDSTKSGSVHITATDKDTTIMASDDAQSSHSAKQTEQPQQPTEKKAFLQTFFDSMKNFFTTMFHWL